MKNWNMIGFVAFLWHMFSSYIMYIISRLIDFCISIFLNFLCPKAGFVNWDKLMVPDLTARNLLKIITNDSWCVNTHNYDEKKTHSIQNMLMFSSQFSPRLWLLSINILIYCNRMSPILTVVFGTQFIGIVCGVVVLLLLLLLLLFSTIYISVSFARDE